MFRSFQASDRFVLFTIVTVGGCQVPSAQTTAYVPLYL
jgi:hypothetical protein